VHLIFFISMLFINTDIDKQLHPESEKEHASHGAHFSESSVFGYDEQMLSGHGGHGPPEVTTR
jgi:hypothetical protein